VYKPSEQKLFSRISQVVNDGTKECLRRDPDAVEDRVLRRLNEAYQAQPVRRNPEKKDPPYACDGSFN
jgi:hypothetical protein